MMCSQRHWGALHWGALGVTMWVNGPQNGTANKQRIKQTPPAQRKRQAGAMHTHDSAHGSGGARPCNELPSRALQARPSDMPSACVRARARARLEHPARPVPRSPRLHHRARRVLVRRVWERRSRGVHRNWHIVNDAPAALHRGGAPVPRRRLEPIAGAADARRERLEH
jgi:hypothetical protein